MENEKKEQSRRDFFLKSMPAAIGVLGVGGLLTEACKSTAVEEEKVSLLSPDGQLVQVDKSAMTTVPVSPAEARQGIPGKIICDGYRSCQM